MEIQEKEAHIAVKEKLGGLATDIATYSIANPFLIEGIPALRATLLAFVSTSIHQGKLKLVE